METLWKEGIDIYDGFARQPFNFRAIIFITIHDYQALFVLLGQIKIRTGYMVCVDGTVSSFLEGSWKVVYLGYRCFLVEGHEVFNMVQKVQVIYGKKKKDGKKRKRDKSPIDGVLFKK